MDKTKAILLLGIVLLTGLVIGFCRQSAAAPKEKAAEAILDFRNEKTENTQPEIENLIRLHVIANSNSSVDQHLKLEVRDAIMRILQLHVNQQTGFTEMQQIICEQLPLLEQVAAEVIRQAGADYSVEAEYGIFEFPAKVSGGIDLEAGYYRAVRVVIGAGMGRNWWCVLFPPASLADLRSEKANLSENERAKCDDYVKNEKHKEEVENKRNREEYRDIRTQTTTKIYLSEWLNKLF